MVTSAGKVGMFFDVFVEFFSNWKHPFQRVVVATQAFGCNGNISVAWLLFIKGEDSACFEKLWVWQKSTCLRPGLHKCLPK